MQFLVCSKVFWETKESITANKGLEIRKMSHALLMRMFRVYKDCSVNIYNGKVYTEDHLQPQKM